MFGLMLLGVVIIRFDRHFNGFRQFHAPFCDLPTQRGS
jgi:hypothetical protein